MPGTTGNFQHGATRHGLSRASPGGLPRASRERSRAPSWAWTASRSTRT
ncbi:MAG: hypothetical protein MZV64_14725 [Ignavibacteriales bacterium]|nr:hypothetical protein [Ignavibacteriales bacterium]